MQDIPFTIREFYSIKDNPNLLDSVMSYHEMKFKQVERRDFSELSTLIVNELGDDQDIQGIYLGTNINVVPDFDCLMIFNKIIINLDLKHVLKSDTFEKVQNKFNSQKRILDLISKKPFNFLFIASERKLYFYNGSGKFNEVPISKFVSILLKLKPDNHNCIKLLKTSDYIISPTENMKDFLKGNYYLEENQREIEKKLFKPGLYGVSGEAGTGKTLIAFDLAKKESDLNKKVLFIFSGELRSKQIELVNQIDNLEIQSAKDCVYKDFNDFDYLIVDEAQKLYSEARALIYNWGKKNSSFKTVVFFYHVRQSLSIKDSGRAVDSLCNSFSIDGIGAKFTLSKKIRSNPAITAFANNLFDLNYKPSPQKLKINDLLDNISIKFFSNASQSKPWIKYLEEKGYAFLIPSGDNLGNRTSSDQFRTDFPEAIDTHKIIGEERNKVVTYIDGSVKYNKYGKLRKNSDEYYFIDNELYVNMTRAKEKLAIAIIKNQDVYNAITNVVLNYQEWFK